MDAAAVNREASVWMKRGIALLEPGAPAELLEAVSCFDRAIDLRRRLPLAEVPMHRYGLAAGWLNHGDALTRLGGEDDLAAAIASFDEGLRLLDGLPLDDDPRVRRRTAIAWQNRGLARQAQGGENLEDARRSFDQARALLEAPAASVLDDRAVLLAAVWTNLANIALGPGDAHAARVARLRASRALDVLAGTDHADRVAAEAGLKARHVLCQAISRLLPAAMNDPADVRALVAEATDAIDDGLAIARRWERNGVDRFRGLAFDLVRFGAVVYGTYQPQFLDEFMRENLDPAQSSGHYVGSAEMRVAALEWLWLSFRRP